jgi:integrase
MAAFMVALKRQKAGGFAARKVIPKDVRHEYAALYGMAWEEKLSIPKGTAPEEAKARHCEWLAEIESRIASLRAAKTGARQPLTRRNAHALAGEWYRWYLARHEGDHRTPSHWQRLSDTLVWDVIYPHAPDEFLSDTRADPQWEWKAHPEVREAVRPLVAQEAKVASFLLEKGMALNEEAMGLFLDAVEDNLLTAYVRLQGLARGDYGPDPVLEQFPEYVRRSERTDRSIQCWTLFERWQTEVQPSRKTVARWKTVFKAADAQFPDANAITPELAKEWMVGLIDENRTARTVATVWKTALKTVFTWAVGEKLIVGNPFKEVRISVPRRTMERETKAFTTEEAEVILWAGLAYEDPQSVDERARRWVPWVCAYTGARAGEITQLRGSDILQRDGHYYAKLSPSAGSIKTGIARTVPLHEHLIEQGFMSFVGEMGSGALFYIPAPPRPAGDPEPVQSPAERTRARLGSWVRSLGISDPELSPNHAWRHTFKAGAARCGMSERYSDAITGHAPPTAGRAYGKPTPEDLANAMRTFPRYSLSKRAVRQATE